MLWAKFASTADRDKAVSLLKLVGYKCGDATVWCNADQPLPIRVQESFLFQLRKLLISEAWGYEKAL
eukprot:12288306-Karenia_brevis.AAC.1